MRQILVYADSLSWGIIPDTRQRLPFDDRWPGAMENELNTAGAQIRVIENCLNGRRTVWEDPFKPGRNGLQGIGQVIEMHSPLALVILMLGTNDFQSMHPHNAWHAARGIGSLVTSIRQAPVEPGMPSPPVLLVAPPPIHTPRGPIAPKFLGADVKAEGLSKAYREIAGEMACAFFDAANVVASSRVDGVHLDRDQHHVLGSALARVVQRLIT